MTACTTKACSMLSVLKQYGGYVTLYETKGTIHGYDFCLNSPITQQSIRHRIHFLKKTL